MKRKHAPTGSISTGVTNVLQTPPTGLTIPGVNWQGGLAPANIPVKPNQKIIRLDINLTIATTRQVFTVTGKSIWVAKASNSLAEIQVKLGTDDNDAMPFFLGSSISGYDFDQIILAWTGQPYTLTLIIAKV